MEASFPKPMLFRCVKVRPVFSMRPQKATIWSKPASRTFEKRQTIRHVGELDAHRQRQKSDEVRALPHEMANVRRQRKAAVPDFASAAPQETSLLPFLAYTRVDTKADGLQHAQLVLKGPPVFLMRPQKATIWGPPASGTLAKFAERSGRCTQTSRCGRAWSRQQRAAENLRCSHPSYTRADPKADGRQHTKLAKGLQKRVRAKRQISQCEDCEAVLEEHPMVATKARRNSELNSAAKSAPFEAKVGATGVPAD